MYRASHHRPQRHPFRGNRSLALPVSGKIRAVDRAQISDMIGNAREHDWPIRLRRPMLVAWQEAQRSRNFRHETTRRQVGRYQRSGRGLTRLPEMLDIIIQLLVLGFRLGMVYGLPVRNVFGIAYNCPQIRLRTSCVTIIKPLPVYVCNAERFFVPAARTIPDQRIAGTTNIALRRPVICGKVLV